MINHIEKMTTLDSRSFEEKIKEVRKVCKEIDVNEVEVMPYNHKIKVKDLVDDIDEGFRHCTYLSRQLLRSELNGLIDTLNCWIDTFNEPRVEVEYLEGHKVGQRRFVAESVADELEYVGLVKRVV